MNKLTFDYSVELLTEVATIDEYYQEHIAYEKTEVLCAKANLTRREYYLAKQVDLQIHLVLLVNSFEYSNQKQLIFDGIKYEVLKTYLLPNGLLELTCSEVKFDDISK